MLTFKELKERAADLAQTSEAELKTQLGNWINLLLENLYNTYDYIDELKDRYTFTTTDGTETYYMPSDFGKAFRMYDFTNNKKINPDVEQDYTDANIANVADSTEADAETYYFTEVVGVNVQISTSGDTVQVKSSSTSDTTEKVRVEGYLDSGLLTLGSETITLNGTTAATATSPLTFYKITHFSKSADTTGFITLQNSSSTDLGILGDVERVARYKAFELRLIPDDSTTSIRVLYKKKFRRLVNDNDYPFVDADAYLTFGAAAMGLRRDKENIQLVQFIDSERDKALVALLTNLDGSLGTDFQQSMQSSIMAAHRS